MTELGINTQADTFVESTEQTSTVQVTYTTSTTTPGYTYTTGVAQTSGVLNYTVTTTTTSTETSSFINAITRRDTRYMTALSSVDPAVELVDGTYKISTPEELAQLATMTNAGLISAGDEFVLANDIDLSGYSNWTPIGNGTNTFTGSFDGNGYVISNLKINRTADYQGLFGYSNFSKFKNLSVINISISNALTSTGGILGFGNGVEIDNVYTSGALQNSTINLGGIAGYIVGSRVQNSYSNCSLNNTSSNTSFSGGIVGSIYSSSIDTCFYNGTITASNTCVGGIAGFSVGDVNIENSFAQAEINTWHGYTGGMIGYLGDTVDKGTLTIKNSYVAGSSNSLNGIFIGAQRNDTFNIQNSWYNSNLNSLPINNASEGTITNVNAYATGNEPFSIIHNAKIDITLITTTTITATETTELSTIGLSSNNTIKVVSKADKTATTGTTSTISVNGSTTIGDLISALQTAGLSATFSAGKISISASDLVYLDAISSALSTEIGINAGSGRSWSSTTVAPVTNTFTHTLSGTTTMGNLGLNSSRNIEIKNNGVNQSISINKNTTFQELNDMLQAKGFTVGLNNGVVSISADSDLYVNSSVLADLLCLGGVNKVDGATYSNLPSGNLGYTINLIDQVGNVYAPGAFTLQIGVNSDENSQITVQTAFSLGGYSDFRNIGVDGNNYLAQIDEILEKLSARQVELGSAQNRLMSALDEITVQRENLISSRSTLRDADIADISSTYIKQQILQQASATLLATANQSAGIALQLI